MNCEIELDMTWPKYCVIPVISRIPEVDGSNPADLPLTTRATTTFLINNAEIYVSIDTFSNCNIKFLENTSQVFKGIISWNKYRSGVTKRTKRQ